jgi:hypothetical protein
MASKKMSLLQQQRTKLKKQRALATTSKAKAIIDRQIRRVTVRIEGQKRLTGASSKPALPPGKKGGELAKTNNRSRRRNVNKNSPSNKTRVGKPGTGGVKPQLRLPPGGKTAVNLLKNNAVARGAAGKLSGIGLILSGAATVQDLAASLKRGEGFASLPKLAKAIAKGNNTKTTSGKTTNRRGRSRSTSTTTKPTKRKMSNIPVGEGTGKGSPNDKKPKTQPGSTKPGGSLTGSKQKTTITKPPKKRDRMETKSKDERMLAWAKANKTQVLKTGTKTQKNLVNRLLRQDKMNAYGGGNRNY